MPTKGTPDSATASQKITRRITSLDDWRGEILARVRELILTADPNIEEDHVAVRVGEHQAH